MALFGLGQTASPASAVVLLATVLLVYTIAKVFYRLFFHPLRSFPGPKLAACTFLYEAYFDLCKAPGGQFIYHLDELHDKYGPIIRCSPEEIHVRDSSWYDTLYTGPSHIRDKWERSNRANNAPGSLASASPHDLHRARRGALGPFFSKQTVRELENSILNKTTKLCSKLRESAKLGETVEVGAASTAVTLDVITDYCFGVCQNALDDPGYGRRWKDLMQGLFQGAPMGKHFPFIVQGLQSLPRPITEALSPDLVPFFEMQGIIDAQARKLYEEEEKAGRIREGGGDDATEEKPATIFHGILQSKLPLAEKSIQRMSDEAFVLCVAGGETTARVITSTITYLIEDPSLYKRLRKELESACSPDELVPESRKLEQVPLMKAVAQEGLRISSPVTNRPQLMAPKEELRYENWLIPRNTPMSMTHRNVLYDPEIFPKPYEFKPERWMEERKDGVKLDRYLVSFGKGVRGCLGMNIAWAEIYTILAAIVLNFDLELVDFDRKRDLEIVRDTFVGLPSRESKGVRVKPAARR